MQHITTEAGVLFDVARDGYARSGQGARDHRHDFAALTSIVFSACSLDAFINEAGLLASEAINPTNPSSVTLFGAQWQEAWKKKKGSHTKFKLAKETFTGTPYDKDKRPFHDFLLLMDVRDALVHHKPRVETVGRVMRKIDPSVWADLDRLRAEIEREPLFSEPKPEGSLLDRLPQDILRAAQRGVTWMVRLSTKDAAGWACNTAAEMVQDFITFVPECPFKIGLRVHHASKFQRV